jgi:cytochrome c oxidase cbb3-type subunit 3
MKQTRHIAITLSTVILLLGFLVSEAGAASKENLAKGELLYNAHCAICHSIGGTGGRGPALTVPSFKRARTDVALRGIIRYGIPGTEMPSAWSINNEESKRIAEYVRSLGRTEQVELPGNIDKGRALYEANNCANCHIVSGSGVGFGPELTNIGYSRSADYLRTSLLRPEADLPSGFAVIQATRANGQPLEGLRLNEDSFTVQLRDANGNFHSLKKAELKKFRKQLNRSMMPKYDKFTTDELNDLVAYMASLRKED